MHYSTLIIPAALFLATGAHARPWAQAADGVWTANNVYYNIRGSTVHEACTTMNTEDVHADGDFCAYWIDGVGDIFSGKCRHEGNSVLCVN